MPIMIRIADQKRDGLVTYTHTYSLIILEKIRSIRIHEIRRQIINPGKIMGTIVDQLDIRIRPGANKRLTSLAIGSR